MEVKTNPDIENAITSYMHCARCFEERLASKIGVGITVNGDIQVWCENHDINIALLELPAA